MGIPVFKIMDMGILASASFLNSREKITLYPSLYHFVLRTLYSVSVPRKVATATVCRGGEFCEGGGWSLFSF